MSMYVPQSGVEVIHPGVITYELQEPIGSSEQWGEHIASLQLTADDQTTYAPLPLTVEKVRSAEQERPAWAGDHFWHHDLCREGSRIGNLVTAIYYADGDESAPGTDVIDTAELASAMHRDGVFEQHGVNEETLAELEVEFSEATYYTDTLPAAARMASPTDRQAIETFLSTRTIDDEPVDPNEYAAHIEQKNGVSRFPLLVTNPFDDAHRSGLMIDTERSRDVVHPLTGLSHKGLLRSMKRYVQLHEEALREDEVIRTIAPEAGKVALITREGSLHRARPGNSVNRRIFIGWLATNPDAMTVTIND